MQSRLGFLALALVLPAFSLVVDSEEADSAALWRSLRKWQAQDPKTKHKHHKHHHKKHHIGIVKPTKDGKVTISKPDEPMKAFVHASNAVQHDNGIVEKMKQLEAKLAAKAKQQASVRALGHLMVNGPLPTDFSDVFAKAVSQATGSDAATVKVMDSSAVEGSGSIVEVSFQASPKVVKDVENEASDPESKLAKGSMHSFLVAGEPEQAPILETRSPAKPAPKPKRTRAVVAAEDVDQEPTPVEQKGIDIDTQMPYGDLEPFGREDTAQELTESSVKESDEMVDQLERAEVAEEKRSVFRALTRLRGAAITSFDGVARSQTGNIDEYNKVHKWRKTHPLHHLADEESDVTKWAFPDNADF